MLLSWVIIVVHHLVVLSVWKFLSFLFFFLIFFSFNSLKTILLSSYYILSFFWNLWAGLVFRQEGHWELWEVLSGWNCSWKDQWWKDKLLTPLDACKHSPVCSPKFVLGGSGCQKRIKLSRDNSCKNMLKSLQCRFLLYPFVSISLYGFPAHLEGICYRRLCLYYLKYESLIAYRKIKSDSHD